MNGTTRTQRLHDAGYRRFVAPPPEPIARSVERTAQVQRLQVLWLREMCEQWPELAEETAGTAREIARADGVLTGVRAGYASEPLTADEPTRKTIARQDEATRDWIASAQCLLSRLEGREGLPPRSSATNRHGAMRQRTSRPHPPTTCLDRIEPSRATTRNLAVCVWLSVFYYSCTSDNKP